MVKKIINGKEVEIKESEYLYCGYFSFNGKERINNGRIQKIGFPGFKSLKTDDLKWKKINDGWATEFAYELLDEDAK